MACIENICFELGLFIQRPSYDEKIVLSMQKFRSSQVVLAQELLRHGMLAPETGLIVPSYFPKFSFYSKTFNYSNYE